MHLSKHKEQQHIRLRDDDLNGFLYIQRFQNSGAGLYVATEFLLKHGGLPEDVIYKIFKKDISIKVSDDTFFFIFKYIRLY